jgi:hypothetical protein
VAVAAGGADRSAKTPPVGLAESATPGRHAMRGRGLGGGLVANPRAAR